MRRATLTGLALVLLSSAAQAAPLPPVSDTAGHYLAPAGPELVRVREAFRDAAARSASDHAGQLFVLPAKYNLVTDADHIRPVVAHFDAATRSVSGTAHGNSWEYDTRIPLVLWGPGVVKPGFKGEQPATQQDLVPTYAQLMGAVPPEDALGRSLAEALLPAPVKPKVILTLVFDQGGEVYYRAHPGATPRVDQLKREGAAYTAVVSHVDCETGIGHVAIGTGAWPSSTGLASNNLWMRGLGSERYSFMGETQGSPIFLNSPSLGDVWLRQTRNQALLGAYCYADRAAIGMAGHGAMFQGNKKPWVIFYNAKKRTLTTNEAFYSLPSYLAGRTPDRYVAALTGGTGSWLGHEVKDARNTPAYVDYDGDNVVEWIAREPWGADDVTDLLYVTLKSTDAAGHDYGHESDEAGAVLAAQDRQLGRIIDALVAKVGKEHVLVALTADHGSTPLAEFSGGARLAQEEVLTWMNRRMDTLDNGVPLVDNVTATQVFVNEAERRRLGLSWEAMKQAILAYAPQGKPFYLEALTRDEARARARKFARP